MTATGAALGTEVLDFDLNLQPGEFYTAVAYGEVAAILPLALVDDYENIATTDVRLVVGHTADGVGTVDVYDFGSGGLLVADLDYGTTETLDVLDEARVVGLDADQDGTVDFLFDVPVLGGSLVNVFAVLPSGGPVLVAQFDDGTTVVLDAILPARIRVLHASPDAPAVDVFVDDAASGIDNLGFTEGTPYVSFFPGLYNFKVSPTGTTVNDAVLDFDVDMAEGVQYSAVAYGNVANILPLALADDDAGIAAGATRLQLGHLADGVGTVSIGILGGAGFENIDGVEYCGTAASVELCTATTEYQAGQITLTLNVTGGVIADFFFTIPNLGGDILVNAFIVLDEAGEPIVLAHLPDGSTTTISAL